MLIRGTLGALVVLAGMALCGADAVEADGCGRAVARSCGYSAMRPGQIRRAQRRAARASRQAERRAGRYSCGYSATVYERCGGVQYRCGGVAVVTPEVSVEVHAPPSE